MLIALPPWLELCLRAEVEAGKYPSVEEAVALAVRQMLGDRVNAIPTPEVPADQPGNIIGALREDAEWLDEIVADAMKARLQETWRPIEVE